MQAKTAKQVKAPLSEWELSKIPRWTEQQMWSGFRAIRDDQFIPDPNDPEIYHKIPWRYVENGCFARAALARIHLYSLGFPGIKKIFIFGKMHFKTAYSLTGEMTFKDHVAIAVRIKYTCYILDPAVCYERPLTLLEWEKNLFCLSTDHTAEFSVCSAFTMSHNSAFDELDPENEVAIRKDRILTAIELAAEFIEKEMHLLSQLK